MPKKCHIKPPKVPTKKPEHLWKGTLYVATFEPKDVVYGNDFPVFEVPNGPAIDVLLSNDIIMALGEVSATKSWRNYTYHRFYHLRLRKNIWMVWEKEWFEQLKGVIDKVSNRVSKKIS